jgi:hypothetical protein
MNWLKFFKLFFRNLIVFTLLSTLLMGVIGFLLSGWTGLVNLAYWGFGLGLLGSLSVGLGMIVEANFWGTGNFERLAEWSWFIKKEEKPKNF